MRALGLLVWVTAGCVGPGLDEREAGDLEKPYEISTAYVCREVGGGDIAAYGQNWSSGGGHSWRKGGADLSTIAFQAGQYVESRTVEGTNHVIAETVRHGVFGPIRDVLYAYTTELTFKPYDEADRSRRVQTVDLKCRSFSGHTADITYFGPHADNARSPEKVSFAIRRILALYPTEAGEANPTKFLEPDPWGPALPPDGSWLRELAQPDPEQPTGSGGRTATLTIEAIDLTAANQVDVWFADNYFEQNVAFRGGRPASGPEIEQALAAGDRNTCVLTARRRDRSETTVSLPAGASAACRVGGGTWDRDGALDPRVYYVDLGACQSTAREVHVRCLRDMTADELSRTFGGKVRITAD